MYVRKVIRENIHNIPIGTYIHSFSFHDKKDETSRVEMWKSESCNSMENRRTVEIIRIVAVIKM